jgi:hypothetical protein
VTKNQKQNLQNLQRKHSISKNQSNASFKLINQSFTSVKSSSQAVEEKMGREKKMAITQQFLQESLQVAMEHSATI